MPKILTTKKQQGKPYTPEQRAEIIQTLKPYLTLGYDLHNACVLAEQPYTTVINWANKDIILCNRIKSWQNMINAKARQNVASSINNGDSAESKWWLERRERDDFSTKNSTDLTSNGQTLGVIQLPMRDGLETTTKTD